uniref:Uncharacterized protein n=1 Tax=uncultured marine virus TaxID=186617 RepID=A0A0F7L6F3_9VIRU|nr:hypothetical protein [uncultured marine virus]
MGTGVRAVHLLTPQPSGVAGLVDGVGDHDGDRGHSGDGDGERARRCTDPGHRLLGKAHLLGHLQALLGEDGEDGRAGLHLRQDVRQLLGKGLNAYGCTCRTLADTYQGGAVLLGPVGRRGGRCRGLL